MFPVDFDNVLAVVAVNTKILFVLPIYINCFNCKIAMFPLDCDNALTGLFVKSNVFFVL